MAIQCPNCESDHVQSAKTIIESGTSRSSGNWSGYAVGAASTGAMGSGYVSGTSNNTAKTDLTQSLENYIFGGKPDKPRYGWVLRILTLLIGSYLLLSAGGYLYAILRAFVYAQYNYILIPVLFIPMLTFWWVWAKKAKTYAKNKKGYQTQLGHWEKSTIKAYNSVYFCHKCGNCFTLNGFSEHEAFS